MRSTLVKAVCAAALMVSVLLTVGGSAGATPATSSGWNDWSCRPSAAQPNPVVMLHGLTGNGHDNWDYMAPRLAASGSCVFSLTYGKSAPVCTGPRLEGGGTGPVAESAEEIAAFMDDVRAATGAARVDLVGHSEGAFMALYIPKVLGRASEVGTVVGLGIDVGGSNAGGVMEPVDLLGARPLLTETARDLDCEAYSDLAPGSPTRRALADGPIAQPGVAYTIINSRFDALELALTPTDTRLEHEPGVEFFWVQDVCPLDPVGHIGLASDPSVYGLVANALDPANAVPVTCGVGLPV